MDIKDFPFLSTGEFSDACHKLEASYGIAELGSLRNSWKLRLRTALGTIFYVSGINPTYIQITCPLKPAIDSRDSLSLDLANLQMSDPVEADDIMAETEQLDTAVLNPLVPQQDPEIVVYEIHLHPTYRVPCLWFSLHNLASGEPAFNIDTIFRRLVPDEYKSGLRQVGGIGSISADHHPITGVPCFFLHPCMVGDALSKFDCSTQNYLMIWLGLVGGWVGLWVPKEMAVQ
ncbi:hypothetical protein CDD81_2284 [Ophiocordyceps australis]|uniref:Ubiquitin-like-conjugating enzyme ATG10 n=1 Tax=Ophiocordyceps australis TaxID=1399860 RepID=A0A2C5YEU8_9HYPO|nr:hypothetical protein CDD81_2284 [Ophiocordyceps australis]